MVLRNKSENHRMNLSTRFKRPVSIYRLILAGLSVVLLLCLSSIEPIQTSKPKPEKASISILTYQKLLKTLLPRSGNLEDDRLNLVPNRDETDFTRVDLQAKNIENFFKTIEKVNQGFGFECITKLLDYSDTGSLSRIFAKFEYKDSRGKLQGVLEQSFFVLEDEYYSRIEHVVLPSGKRMSKEIIDETLKVLREISPNPRNRIELEAASGKSLVGAYVWAKRGFQFLPGEKESLTNQLVRYLHRVHPFEPLGRIHAWINKQGLANPSDFAALTSYQANKLGWFKKLLTNLHLKSAINRRFAKSQPQLGLAFLLDPQVAAHWEGEINVNRV